MNYPVPLVFINLIWTIDYFVIDTHMCMHACSLVMHNAHTHTHTQVQPGEHVIDQGDDGDNFYVVDKYVKHSVVLNS